MSSASSAASATYRIQGKRDDFFQTKEEKNILFSKALNSTHHYLFQNPEKSIQNLVNDIYNTNMDDENLNNMREALKYMSLTSFQERLSATGNKFLAYLAVISNESLCLNANKTINLEETKKAIRGFFSNGDIIDFDDSAIKNLKFTDDNFCFGKKRYASLRGVHSNKAVFVAIQERIPYATNKLKSSLVSLDINFDEIPLKKIEGNIVEMSGGDSHGNPKLVLYELIHGGFLKIKDTGAWNELMEHFDRNTAHTKTAKLIRDVLEPTKNFHAKYISLGNNLADKFQNGNDAHLGAIFHFLEECKISFKIIHSNHDMETIRYYLRNKDKGEDQAFELELCPMLNENDATTLTKLHAFLSQSRPMKKLFKEYMAVYVRHISVFEIAPDQKHFYGHGAVNDRIYIDCAKKANIQNPETMEPQAVVAIINRWFQNNVLTSLKAYEEEFPMFRNSARIHYDGHPFLAAAWSIGPGKDATRGSGTKYVSDLTPPRGLTVVHGHTPQLEGADKYITLDGDFGLDDKKQGTRNLFVVCYAS